MVIVSSCLADQQLFKGMTGKGLKKLHFLHLVPPAKQRLNYVLSLTFAG
jgi:hypothetical protein